MVAGHDEKLFILCPVKVKETENQPKDQIDCKKDGEN